MIPINSSLFNWYGYLPFSLLVILGNTSLFSKRFKKSLSLIIKLSVLIYFFISLRKSVVSGEVIDKRDLLRIVKNKEGEIFIDPTGKKNGRGAYIKLDNEEAIQAKNKKVFNRSFSMEVPDEFYDELIAYVDHKVKRRELGLE